MAGQITSFEVMTSQPTNMVSFCRTISALSINVSLVRCALTEQKQEGIPSISPLYDGGGTS